MHIPEIEIQSPSEIKRFQENKLREHLIYLQDHSPFYKNLFKIHNIHIGKIQALEDLSLIPTTSKDDLQQQNLDFLCVGKNQVIDYVTTSGTLGEPVTFALTENDLNRLAYNEYLGLACADGTSEDIYQITTTLDKRFMAGLAYFMGIRKLGAGVVRVGPGIPELQWDTIHRIKPTTLMAVPSFILKLIEYAEKNGIDYQSSSIKKAVCIGEPLRNPDFSLNTLGQKIQEKWPIGLFSTYASTEMSTAFTECKHGIGGHLHPELIIVELLDEEGNLVAKGEAGEVTITSLGVEGMPLLRFRTGDICQLFDEPCRCGRNTLRLGPVIGRKKHMIKYKGTTLFPPAIVDTLNAVDGIDAYLIEVYTDTNGNDGILIKVASADTSDNYAKLIKDHFRAKIRVAPEIVFEALNEINKVKFDVKSRKPIDFVDNRNVFL
jgi:phenylacetate-CoA ligase